MKIKDFYTREEIELCMVYKNEDHTVIKFGYCYGKNQVIAKFKYEKEFVEVISKGSSSSSSSKGKKESTSCKSIIGKYEREFNFYEIYDDKAFIDLNMNDFGMMELDKDITIEEVGEIEFITLPKIEILSNVLSFDDDILIISRSKYNYDGKDNIHKSDNNGDLKKININDKVLYRDGGTTIYSTDVGEIYIETPFSKNREVKLNGEQGNIVKEYEPLSEIFVKLNIKS